VEKNSHNIKIYKRLFSLLLAGGLSMTLVGCGVSETSFNVSNTSTSNEQSSEENNLAEGVKNAVIDEYEKTKDSNAIEASIIAMIDGAAIVDNATDEFKQTSEYQEAKDELISNFDTLLNFCFNNQEINGYTFSDLSDSGKEKALSALFTLDGAIEKNIPDYKNKAKQKLEQFGAFVYDKSTDLGADVKSFASNWLDDVKEKAKQR